MIVADAREGHLAKKVYSLSRFVIVGYFRFGGNVGLGGGMFGWISGKKTLGRFEWMFPCIFQLLVIYVLPCFVVVDIERLSISTIVNWTGTDRRSYQVFSLTGSLLNRKNLVRTPPTLSSNVVPN